MNSLDITVQTFLISARTPMVTDFMYIVSTLFDFSAQFILIALCVAGLIFLVRGKKYTLLFSLSLIIGGALIYLLKIFFDVSRPLNFVVSAFGQSFPSGHATTATIFFGMLVYIFDDCLSRIWRNILNIFCLLSVILVSFSRLYLGAHWLSDISGGILLGFVVTYLSIKVFNTMVK